MGTPLSINHKSNIHMKTSVRWFFGELVVGPSTLFSYKQSSDQEKSFFKFQLLINFGDKLWQINRQTVWLKTICFGKINKGKGILWQIRGQIELIFGMYAYFYEDYS